MGLCIFIRMQRARGGWDRGNIPPKIDYDFVGYDLNEAIRKGLELTREQ